MCILSIRTIIKGNSLGASNIGFSPFVGFLPIYGSNVQTPFIRVCIYNEVIHRQCGHRIHVIYVYCAYNTALKSSYMSAFFAFPCGVLGQVWCLIVSIPNLCHLTYYMYVWTVVRCITCSSPESLVHAHVISIRNTQAMHLISMTLLHRRKNCSWPRRHFCKHGF